MLVFIHKRTNVQVQKQAKQRYVLEARTVVILAGYHGRND